jgi:hypothetical protein
MIDQYITAFHAFVLAHPAGYYGGLTALIFFMVYGSRKVLPTFWSALELDNPVGSKLLQALPGALFGMTVAGITDGGVAFYGLLCSAVAVLIHHLAKAYEGIPYAGELGKVAGQLIGKAAKRLSTTGSILILLTGCALVGQAAKYAPAVLDIARQLCEVTAADRTGFDPKKIREEVCTDVEVARTWVPLVREASQTGAVRTGLSRPTCDADSRKDCL